MIEIKCEKCHRVGLVFVAKKHLCPIHAIPYLQRLKK